MEILKDLHSIIFQSKRGQQQGVQKRLPQANRLTSTF